MSAGLKSFLKHHVLYNSTKIIGCKASFTAVVIHIVRNKRSEDDFHYDVIL